MATAHPESVRSYFLGCGLLFPQRQSLSEQRGSPQVELSSPSTLALCRVSRVLPGVCALNPDTRVCSSAEQRCPLKSSRQAAPHPVLSHLVLH